MGHAAESFFAWKQSYEQSNESTERFMRLMELKLVISPLACEAESLGMDSSDVLELDGLGFVRLVIADEAGDKLSVFRITDPLWKIAKRIRTKESAKTATPTEIPPEYRSKPIPKKKAAKLLGRTGDENRAVEWLNNWIGDGIYSCMEMSRQSFCFDMRQFPEDKRQQLKP